MQHENTVENLLRLQLSSDALAVLYLPSILSILSPVNFSSNAKDSLSTKTGPGAGGANNTASSRVAPMTPAVLNRWCTRVTSLMQSKDAGARWAGICLARRTGELRRDMLVEYAQRWINLTLPCLSRPERLPVWKASIDLLVFVFMATSHLSEFRRQVSTPTVPKLSIALLELSGNGDETLKLLIFDSLATLVGKFPTLHRSLAHQITSITIQALAGSFPNAHSGLMVRGAAHLLASMHHTEGKIGGPLAWRNTLDSVSHEAWKCINILQSSLVKEVPPTFTPKKILDFPVVSSDPLVAVQVLLSRLNNMVVATEALFRVNPSRPVLVPISILADIAIRLLRSTQHVQTSQPQGDAVREQLESQLVPELVRTGATLSCILVTSLRHNMTPHATPILSSLAYQLEQDISPARRHHLLHSLTLCLDHITSHAPLLPARLFRAVVPSLSPLLPSKRAIGSITTANGEAHGREGGRKGKGKKRMRDFEGDESLGGSDGSLAMTSDEASVMLQALEVLQRVLRMPCLPASIHSLGTRLLLSLHIYVTNNPPSGIGVVLQGTDGSFQTHLQAKLVELQGELSLGTAGYAWRGMNLTMQLLESGDEDTLVLNATTSTMRLLDALIHPRLPPPTLRRLPAPESLMLFNYEESAEERGERTSLHIDDGTSLRMDVEVRKVAVDKEHPFEREDDIRNKTIDNGDRVDGSHAMEFEIAPPKSPSIAQSIPWPQDPIPTSTELMVRPDQVMQRPKAFGGFGVKPALFEDKDASSVQQAMAHDKPPLDTAITNPIENFAFKEPQFVGMGNMSDDEPIPSIDMGSDSD